MRLDGFLKALSSSAPTPGGGAAAALAGAMAAALVEMVSEISARRSERPEELAGIRDRARGLREALTRAIEEDSRAYDEVSRALKLPKDTQEEKDRRRREIEQALKGAAEVPLGTARGCLEALELATQALPLASKYVRSDLAVAAQLGQAGLMSALYNVDANCLMIKDGAFLAQMAAERKELSRKGEELAGKLLAELEEELTAWSAD